MFLWWGKFLFKDVKRKSSRGSFIDVIYRKFKSGLEGKNISKFGGFERFINDIVLEKGLVLLRLVLIFV